MNQKPKQKAKKQATIGAWKGVDIGGGEVEVILE